MQTHPRQRATVLKATSIGTSLPGLHRIRVPWPKIGVMARLRWRGRGTCEGNTCTRPRWFVHLSVHKSALRLSYLVAKLVHTLQPAQRHQDGARVYYNYAFFKPISSSKRRLLANSCHDNKGGHCNNRQLAHRWQKMLTPSIISLYRSLPSRVLSPTPANTEKPPA